MSPIRSLISSNIGSLAAWFDFSTPKAVPSVTNPDAGDLGLASMKEQRGMTSVDLERKRVQSMTER